MELLWVADAALLLVVAPLVLLFAGRVLKHLRDISKLADTTLTHGLRSEERRVGKECRL